MSAPIRILIRADAGRSIGTGHLARASAVAEVLADCGMVEVMLAAGRDATALVPAYFPSGIDLIVLPDELARAEDLLQWLGDQGRLPDAVYLDHYGEVAAWEQAAAIRGVGLLVLDDLDAAERADVIVRPHGGGGNHGDSVVLRGPANLPLLRQVTDLAGRRKPQVGRDRLVLNVCFGGTDPTHETAKAIEALAGVEGIDVDVIIGPGAAVEPDMIAAAENTDQITIHRAPSQTELAHLMSDADFALGAGGVMLWERLCLGLPSLVIAVADNQRPQIDTMAACGAIRFLGDHADVTSGIIAEAIDRLAADAPGRAAMRKTGQELVDGHGAVRIAAWLRALALEVRDVTLADGPSLLQWRTNERNWAHNWDASAKPELADHMAWLSTRLGDPNCIFRIVVREDCPTGVVRFDLSDDGRDAYLSIYLVPEWRGYRLGLPVLFAAERALRRSHPGVERIVSRIYQGNEASVRLHRDAGFRFTQSVERADWYDAVKTLG